MGAFESPLCPQKQVLLWLSVSLLSSHPLFHVWSCFFFCGFSWLCVALSSWFLLWSSLFMCFGDLARASCPSVPFTASLVTEPQFLPGSWKSQWGYHHSSSLICVLLTVTERHTWEIYCSHYSSVCLVFSSSIFHLLNVLLDLKAF